LAELLARGEVKAAVADLRGAGADGEAHRQVFAVASNEGVDAARGVGQKPLGRLDDGDAEPLSMAVSPQNLAERIEALESDADE
jgi:hypothetical protein